MKDQQQQQQQQSAQQQHPMVSVPEALRIVLRETARCWIQQQQQQDDVASTSSSSSSSSSSTRNCIMLSLPELVVGQRLADNVYMPEPGYPAYNASIMDGYCIQTRDYIKYYHHHDDNNENTMSSSEEKKNHEFLVIDKVYAGDDDDEKQQKRVNVGNTHNLPTACYITTGAVVPDCYDCVIPIEEVVVQVQQQQNSSFNDGSSSSSSNSTTTTRTIITVSPPATAAKMFSPGQWIRATGCDIAAGSVVLPKHHVLNAISIGLLYQVLGGTGSSRGAADVPVVAIQPRIRVGILSTGNEIYDINDTTNADTSSSSSSSGIGKIPDVNRPILLSLLQQDASWKDCCDGVDLGMVRDDDVELVTSRLQMAIETCDVVITTGGISMGETDIIEHVLVDRLGGTLHFGRLHMKPGKPTTFVTFEQDCQNQNNHNDKKKKKPAMVFAMPGNPVSATVCTILLVQPAVRFLYFGPDDESADNTTYGDSSVDDNAWLLDRMVENATVHVEVQALLAQDLQLDVERPEYHRVRLDYHYTNTHNGPAATGPTTITLTNITATSTGVQRSSRLLSLLNADGLAVLPQAVKTNNGVAAAGTICTVLLLRNPYSIPAATVRTSLHLNDSPSPPNRALLQSTATSTAAAATKPPLCIGIIQIKPNQGEGESSSGSSSTSTTGDSDQEKVISDLVQTALSGSKSGSALVVSFHVYSAANNKEPTGLYYFMQKQVEKSSNVIDLMIIIGPTTTTTTESSSSSSSSSCFLYHTATANALRQQLSKTADALAMQARRGAAAQDPKAAVYETVVGYLNGSDVGNSSSSSSSDSSNDGVLVIFLSALGLEGGLCNVRGLLKHALQIARGGADHHRQKQHQHHHSAHGHHHHT